MTLSMFLPPSPKPFRRLLLPSMKLKKSSNPDLELPFDPALSLIHHPQTPNKILQGGDITRTVYNIDIPLCVLDSVPALFRTEDPDHEVVNGRSDKSDTAMLYCKHLGSALS